MSLNPSGEPMPVGDIPNWHQIFTDDFTTDVPVGQFPAHPATVNKWGVYPSPWKDSSKFGTYSPAQVVSIKDSILTKHLATMGGVVQVAALLPKFAQMYGRYALRFRFDNLPGYKIAWLLWPNSGNRADGEIDFPEMNLDGPDVYAFNHGPGPQTQFHAPLVGEGGWQTAVIEWTAGLIVFLLNGVEIGRTTTRVPTAKMHWVIQTECWLPAPPTPPPVETAGVVQIDWVAAWKWTPGSA